MLAAISDNVMDPNTAKPKMFTLFMWSTSQAIY